MLFGSVRKPTMRDVITAIELPRRPVNLAMDEAAAPDTGASFAANMSLPFDTSDFNAGILLRFMVVACDVSGDHAGVLYLLTISTPYRPIRNALPN